MDQPETNNVGVFSQIASHLDRHSLLTLMQTSKEFHDYAKEQVLPYFRETAYIMVPWSAYSSYAIYHESQALVINDDLVQAWKLYLQNIDQHEIDVEEVFFFNVNFSVITTEEGLEFYLADPSQMDDYELAPEEIEPWWDRHNLLEDILVQVGMHHTMKILDGQPVEFYSWSYREWSEHLDTLRQLLLDNNLTANDYLEPHMTVQEVSYGPEYHHSLLVVVTGREPMLQYHFTLLSEEQARQLDQPDDRPFEVELINDIFHRAGQPPIDLGENYRLRMVKLSDIIIRPQ